LGNWAMATNINRPEDQDDRDHHGRGRLGNTREHQHRAPIGPPPQWRTACSRSLLRPPRSFSAAMAAMRSCFGFLPISAPARRRGGPAHAVRPRFLTYNLAGVSRGCWCLSGRYAVRQHSVVDSLRTGHAASSSPCPLVPAGGRPLAPRAAR